MRLLGASTAHTRRPEGHHPQGPQQACWSTWHNNTFSLHLAQDVLQLVWVHVLQRLCCPLCMAHEHRALPL